MSEQHPLNSELTVFTGNQPLPTGSECADVALRFDDLAEDMLGKWGDGVFTIALYEGMAALRGPGEHDPTYLQSELFMSAEAPRGLDEAAAGQYLLLLRHTTFWNSAQTVPHYPTTFEVTRFDADYNRTAHAAYTLDTDKIVRRHDQTPDAHYTDLQQALDDWRLERQAFERGRCTSDIDALVMPAFRRRQRSRREQAEREQAKLSRTNHQPIALQEVRWLEAMVHGAEPYWSAPPTY